MMNISNFDFAVGYVLKNECGFVDRADDAGGPTNFGITLKTLSQWRKKDCSTEDVKNMQVDEAKAIYKAYFWDFLKLEEIQNAASSTSIMDVAVNCGPNKAVMLAQKALNALGSRLQTDGVFGTGSQAALNHQESAVFLTKYIPLVQENYIEDVIAKPDQIANLKGWLSRSQRLLTLMV